jgi:hypothetical protein
MPEDGFPQHAAAVRGKTLPSDDSRTGDEQGVAVLSLARAARSQLRHEHSATGRALCSQLRRAHSAVCGEERDAACTALPPPPSDSN